MPASFISFGVHGESAPGSRPSLGGGPALPGAMGAPVSIATTATNGCEKCFSKWSLKELVYVKQPPGFEDINFPNHVYKLDKALDGLKQAPRAWYEHLRELFLDRGFEVGQIDPTLFTKRV